MTSTVAPGKSKRAVLRNISETSEKKLVMTDGVAMERMGTGTGSIYGFVEMC